LELYKFVSLIDKYGFITALKLAVDNRWHYFKFGYCLAKFKFWN